MSQLKDNPLYKVAYQHEAATFYMPIDITGYHKSRELHMQATERFALCGISKEVLQSLAGKLIELANNQLANPTLRSDVSVIGNNLLARMREPVDELCAVRMGAIACFIEGEDPDSVHMAWTDRKMKLAEQHPGIYTFFLHMGISFIPDYVQHLRTLNVEDYLESRKQMLNTLTLAPTP